ncbi:DUF2971 domain-containing protein [Xanthobacter aminoxidans]|uniref:DUF2971 domain-containing protein n=1 Tax=Xanthobacter aminoxidans TaxID=186280 RepID=A0ABW6ZMC2_9HYPH
MQQTFEEPSPHHPPQLQTALGQFQVWCQAQLAEEEEKDRVIEPLYQYTSAAGLQGILESETMWFTDYRHLNDPSEVWHGMEHAREIFQASRQGADPRAQFFLDYTGDLLSRENIATFEFFVASFSSARDDLGQWRAYGDNGRGFAIGFAPQMFAPEPAEPGLPPEKHSFVGRVRYKPEQIIDRSRRAIHYAADHFLTTAVKNSELMSDKAIGLPFTRELSVQLVEQLIWHALTSKHHAYENEREVRMLMLGSGSMLKGVTKTRMRGSAEFVPYIAHAWPVREPGNLVEVVAGPAANIQVAKSLLDMRGLTNVMVNPSTIPYRPA